MEGILGDMGLQLQRSKCKAWIRNATAINDALNAVVPQVLDGIPLLGSALEGDLETHLGPYDISAGPALGRLTRAVHFAQQIPIRQCEGASGVCEPPPV